MFRLAFVLVLLTCMTAMSALAQDRSYSVDQDALEALRQAAMGAHSDAVYIVVDGKVVADWTFGHERRPIETMSVLKSIVGIAVGRLIELEHLESIDVPVAQIYPEWNQGRKKEVLIRHLLNHTSGLQDVANAGAEIYPSPNAIRLALAAELVEDPGSRFRYNNKATNLLAGIIQESCGRRMDQFVVEELFRAMDIDQYKWYYDASGNPHAMAGLELYAEDLAKFGQLVLNRGVWEESQLVDASYIDEMLEVGHASYPLYGLLWWRLPVSQAFQLSDDALAQLKEHKVDNSTIERFSSFEDKSFPSIEARDSALTKSFGREWRSELLQRLNGLNFNELFDREVGEIVAYYGDGYLGQTLMVIPEYRAVAVRQLARSDTYDPKSDGFREFKRMVLALFP